MQLEIHTSSYPARRVEEETVKEQQGASQLEELRWDDGTLSSRIMGQWQITNFQEIQASNAFKNSSALEAQGFQDMKGNEYRRYTHLPLL